MDDNIDEFYDLVPGIEEPDEHAGFHFGDEKRYLSIAETLAADSIDCAGKRNPDLKYRPEYAQVAYELCRGGATDKQLADAFNVAPSTITTWAEKYPRFQAMRRGGKIFGNTNIVNSAYKIATGYKIYTEKLITVPLGNNMGSDVEKHKVLEYVPGNPRMIEYWLNNRDPDNWAAKSTIDHKNNGGSFADAARNMSTAEIQAQADALEKLEDSM